MTMPVSLCLVVRDEADRLLKSLPVWQGRVAQLLVYVDSQTKDNTRELLSGMGATVIEGPWLGFSQTRRALWAMAEAPWIVWLDADEVCAKETLDALEKALVINTAAGFRFKRRVVFEGKTIRWGDWGNDWVLRVFRRGEYHMEPRAVHESVTVEGPVEDLPGVVAHYSFRSWDDLRARSNRYAQLWAQQAYQAGKKPGNAWLRAGWKFLRGYIIKSGWLDGALGFRIALHNAREVYDKYRQLADKCREPKVERV